MSAAPRNNGATLLIGPAAALPAGLRVQLRDEGLALHLAADGAEGLRLFHATLPAVVALDLALPDRDALALLAEFLALRPGTRILALAPAAATERAVAAMRAGAADVLMLPLPPRRLAETLRDEAAGPALRPRARQSGETTDPSTFIGSSPQMAAIHRTIASVARSMATVFITGESGTGKELAALAVHAQSGRAAGPFIALNCGAIPPDLLESEVFGHVKGSFTGAIADKPGAAVAADGGTLFLDEICEMAPALQTKLLRFLQTSTVQPVGATRPRKVDVRIVCATNRDPVAAVTAGQFREDLFYRLYVVPLHLPPLRTRGRDVIEIAEAALLRFAEEENKRFEGLAPETVAHLLAQDWPGNVRQVLNVIRNVVVLHHGGEVTPDMLPASLPARSPAEPPHAPIDSRFAGLTLAQLERQAIEAALARHAGSVPRAARELDVSPSTLYRKLDAWGLKG
ncbi:MAG: sigma-54-dependent Fis family transcriptional regulator [Rhodobacteraceae bacterium]|jgi:two-component system repressor protein LuxO|nr:sigma-54-dependent Fis family transcriptional regulator [Paracoccaceae bacterium]